MRNRIFSMGLLMTALSVLVFLSYRVAAEPDAQGGATTGESSPISEQRAKVAADRKARQLLERIAEDEATHSADAMTLRAKVAAGANARWLREWIAEDEATHSADDVIGRAKVAAGPNANAVLSLDLDIDASDPKMDDGNKSGTVAGAGTDVVVEVFITGLAGPIIGGAFSIDTNRLTVKSATATPGLSVLGTTATTVSLGGFPPGVALPNGYLGTVTLTTTSDVTGTEFTVSASINVADGTNIGETDMLTAATPLTFNAMGPTPDFNGDGTVGFADFLAFAGQFGTRRGDGRYQAKYDLNGDGAIDFRDFLSFAGSYGQSVPPSGGGGSSGGSSGGGSGGSGGGGDIVVIPDARLRSVISDNLNKARGAPITRADMATLTSLAAVERSINDLTGLEYATNLIVLSLYDNQISDLAALSGLTNLIVLSLGGNQISDLAALSGLTNLRTLYLYNNQISDLAALSGLTNLIVLSLGGNQISDLAALSGLTNLRTLYLYNNQISDLAALSGLTNLTSLWLFGNPLSATSINTHIPALRARGVVVIGAPTTPQPPTPQPPTPQPPGDDHSNTRSGATSLSLGGSRSGRIETGGDVDYFRVQVSRSGTLTVYTTGSTDTYGTLQSSSGTTLETDDDDGSGTNFSIARSVSAGTYYIAVRGYSSSETGSYTVHASFQSGGSGGGGSGGGSDDHSNTRSGATSLSLGGSRSGRIETGGDVDYFRVQVSRSGTLTVYTTGSTDTYGTLQSSSGTTLETDDDDGSGTNFSIARSVSAGTYYIKVEEYGNNDTGSYTVHASFQSSGSGGGGSGGGSDDHSNTRSGATSLSLGGSRSGRIETGGDVDYFRVQVSRSGTLTVYTTGSTDTYGTLQSSSGTTLETDDDDGSGTNFSIARSVSAGTYYIKVEEFWYNTGSYTVHASFQSGGSSGGGGACSVGQVLSPGQSCNVGNNRFEVRSDGYGCLGFVCAGESLTINRFRASKIAGTSRWRIDALP